MNAADCAYVIGSFKEAQPMALVFGDIKFLGE